MAPARSPIDCPDGTTEGQAPEAPDGGVGRTCLLPDGTPHGPLESWYSDGTPCWQGQYVTGEKDGLWRLWERDGRVEAERRLAQEGNYLSGEKVGEWRQWLEGVLIVQGVYVDGKRSGGWTEWYPNGQMWKRGSYLDDLATGPWTYWHENGQKHREGRFERFVTVGTWTWWKEDGSLEKTCAYDAEGQELCDPAP